MMDLRFQLVISTCIGHNYFEIIFLTSIVAPEIIFLTSIVAHESAAASVPTLFDMEFKSSCEDI